MTRRPTLHAAMAVAIGLFLVGCGQSPPTASPPVPTRTVGEPSATSSLPLASIDPAASPSTTPAPSGGAAGSPAATTPATATPSVEAEPAPIRVVEAGFTAFADGNDFASFAAILENPNTAWAAIRMRVTIELFAPGDEFVGGDELVVQILPGQRTAIAGEVFGAGRATRLEVRLPDDTTAFESRRPRGRFDVSSIHTSRDDGLNKTGGRLTNRFDTDETLVQLIAVYRDQRGSIVGGAVGGVDSIESGDTLVFEIIDSAPHRQLAATEVYWQVNGLRR